jgi:hypothetical protein
MHAAAAARPRQLELSLKKCRRWVVIPRQRFLISKSSRPTSWWLVVWNYRKARPSVRIRRVRLADRMPLSFDETYLPKELGQKVMADNLDTEPIFSLLEQKYNTPLVEAEYQLEAVCAHATVGTALRIGVGSAIFLIDRTSYSIGHRLSRLRKASLPGRPDPIRDPPSTADPRPAERRFPRMNFRRTLPRGRKHKNLGCVVRHRMNADLLQSNEQKGYSPLSQVR